MHDALRQAHEEQLVVDRARATGLLAVTVRVVQKYQVEVGRVAELSATELAVTQRTDVDGAALGSRTAAGYAELRRDLPPAELQCALDNELGDVGEPVAHLHQRQHAGEIGDRDAEQRRALELAQCLDLQLR